MRRKLNLQLTEHENVIFDNKNADLGLGTLATADFFVHQEATEEDIKHMRVKYAKYLKQAKEQDRLESIESDCWDEEEERKLNRDYCTVVQKIELAIGSIL